MGPENYAFVKTKNERRAGRERGVKGSIGWIQRTEKKEVTKNFSKEQFRGIESRKDDQKNSIAFSFLLVHCFSYWKGDSPHDNFSLGILVMPILCTNTDNRTVRL